MATNTNTEKNRETQARAQKSDIVDLILEDHKPLKELIKVLKNGDADMSQRQRAFDTFAVELIAHAKPEENVLYAKMKQNKDLREDAFEGDVEHQLADQMLEEARRTTDPDMWSARVKVLAELLEHHIEEEEEELLPHFRKNSEAAERSELGLQFLKQKTEWLAKGGSDSPSEDSLH